MNPTSPTAGRSPLLRVLHRLVPLSFVLLLALAPVTDVVAQRVSPPGGRVRAYVPSDELVSFLPTTPFNEFVRLINPVFLRVTGKAVVDPMDRTEPIGVSLNGVHFIDAFELVLERSRLDFRESENYFVIQDVATVPTSDQLAAGAALNIPAGAPLTGGNLPASAESREIRIDAIIFELNASRVRETGTNWATLFGEAGGSSGGGTGGGTGGGEGSGSERPQFFLDGSSFFDALDGFISSSTDRIELSVLLRLFRWFETQGYGETVASPSVTVQSGESGKMQSGSDIPIQIQDFQGNTITQFVSTGIIIDVTPTLILDENGGGEGDAVEFVHLNVKVEKSSGRPGTTGLTIDKSDVNTQVLLLDGEQTVIGGLYSTEEAHSRKGIPLLMDIPLLKYLFSYKTRSVVQKELVIVLQARVVDSLPNRAGRPLPSNLYQQERDTLRDRLDRFRPGTGQEYDTITPDRTRYNLPDAQPRNEQ